MPPGSGRTTPPSPRTTSAPRPNPSWRSTRGGSSPPCEAGETIPELPETLISSILDNTWHDTAEAIINNWIGKVYQITHQDRRLVFKQGINPQDPLGLRR